MAVALEHLPGQIQQAVAGGFPPGQAAAIGKALAGEDALKHIADLPVLAKHIADLPGAHADIAGGHIRIRADVLGKLHHKGLAEAHDLPVGLALGVKVGAALGAAHRQAGKGILEDLLKAQELDNAQIHGRMEAQTALVGADGTVELDTVATVQLHLAVVIHPGHAEDDGTLGGGQPLQDRVPAVGRLIALDNGAQRFQHFFHRLVKFRLIQILLPHSLQDLIHIIHRPMPPNTIIA